MSQRDTGGSAFPYKFEDWDPDDREWKTQYVHEGMTLRDYFAAKAMHQFLRGAVLPVGYDATNDLRTLADRAYEMADAMLKARQS